jgi:hypothetical protein
MLIFSLERIISKQLREIMLENIGGSTTHAAKMWLRVEQRTIRTMITMISKMTLQ